MRLIDADELKKCISESDDLSSYGMVIFKDMVNDQPTIDSVKNCASCDYRIIADSVTNIIRKAMSQVVSKDGIETYNKKL